jgi:hypothetical protein
MYISVSVLARDILHGGCKSLIPANIISTRN